MWNRWLGDFAKISKFNLLLLINILSHMKFNGMQERGKSMSERSISKKHKNKLRMSKPLSYF